METDFICTVEGSTATITGYIGQGGAVTIPATIDSKPIVRIGDWAFRNCTSLTAITIPMGVMSIGEQAFRDCTALRYVMIPNSVLSLGDNVFGNCGALITVAIYD
jgi:hypothetical protein